MQAASDIFLGWVHVESGLDGRERDFYGRQLKDWKGSAEVEQMVPEGMATYGKLCGWTLARAHARSGDRIAIAAYLGQGTSFDRAIVEFSKAYAEQNERDYKALLAAVESGRITAETGSLAHAVRSAGRAPSVSSNSSPVSVALGLEHRQVLRVAAIVVASSVRELDGGLAPQHLGPEESESEEHDDPGGLRVAGIGPQMKIRASR